MIALSLAIITTAAACGGDRMTVDWNLDAVNILNRVTFASVNLIPGSTQFGLPNLANPMRKVQTSLRVGF